MGWGGGHIREGGFIEGSWYESINKFTIRLLTGLNFIFYSNGFRILHLAGSNRYPLLLLACSCCFFLFLLYRYEANAVKRFLPEVELILFV